MAKRVIIERTKGTKFDTNGIFELVREWLDTAEIVTRLRTTRQDGDMVVVIESEGKTGFDVDEVYGYILNELENECVEAYIHAE